MRLPDLAPHARPVALAYGSAMGLAAVVGALALPGDGLAVSLSHFWWIGFGSLFVLLTLVLQVGMWTAAGAYAAVFWCFHFGLIVVLGSGFIQPKELSLWDQLWVFGPFAADAALLALIGFAALASGVSFGKARTACKSPEPVVAREGAHSHGIAGSVLVFVSVAVWCAVVVGPSGLGGFFVSYREYLDATAGSSALLGLVWMTLGCGAVMSFTGRHGWVRTAAIGVLSCLAVVALPLGLRGELMFPAIAVVVAAARCGWVLSPARAGALVAALLLIIPTVREVRTTGLQGVPDMVLDQRLFDAFVEMGGSLHPVEKVVRWRTEGEAFELGGSYWAPIERAAARVLPGLRAAAAEDDMRIMNVLVTDRVGAIGFSPVAEAYRNFGPPGVLLVLWIIGALLARLDGIADRRLAVLAIATLYVPLLVNVRNSFVAVPLQCALGVLFVLALWATRHILALMVQAPHGRNFYVGGEVSPWSR